MEVGSEADCEMGAMARQADPAGSVLVLGVTGSTARHPPMPTGARAMSETTPPRRWRMKLDLQADTIDDMVAELDHIGFRLAVAAHKGESRIRVTSGGYLSGFVLDVDRSESDGE